MKLLVAILSFALVIGFNLQSVAKDKKAPAVKPTTAAKAEAHDAENAHPEVHPAGEENKGHAEEKHEAHKGGHEALGEKMNSLFPEKQPTAGRGMNPPKPTLVAPAFFSSQAPGTVKLEWKPVESVSNFRVQVATDPNFKWLVTSAENVNGTTFEVSGLEAGKHYHWRVMSIVPENHATNTKSFWAASMFQTTK